ncbi:putative glycosyltransferase EpsJ [Ensifer adhaerens]|nr:putative glycosyltransferase EpsJ [Ensifer adhaerens]
MSKVSVIIPAYNAQDSLGDIITAVLENREVLEVIIVDDTSRDATALIVEQYARRDERVRLLRNPENRGAGYSRNAGMAAARGDYYYFLDADDMIAHRSIDEVIYHMEANGCDVMVFRYRYITDKNDRLGPMLQIDDEAWRQLVGDADIRIFTLQQCARLLFTVNFPWNKIVSAKLCRETGLRFSETRVHNDIYAHWHIYMHAQRIGMMNRYLIGHRVYEERAQLTNVFTEKRFEIFTAFEEVEALFARLPLMKQAYYQWFLCSKLDLLQWIYPRLPVNLRERFLTLITQSYAGYDEPEYNYVRAQSPQMAEVSLRLKRTPHLVLGRLAS